MSRFIRSAGRLALLAAASAAVAMPLSSQAEEAVPADRVAVSREAPDFTLPDPDGVDHAASALRGEKNLLLVFFRGAW